MYAVTMSEREPTANISTSKGNCVLDAMATTYNFYVINRVTVLGIC